MFSLNKDIDWSKSSRWEHRTHQDKLIFIRHCFIQLVNWIVFTRCNLVIRICILWCTNRWMHLNHATHSDQVDVADVFCTFTTCIVFVKLSVEYLDYQSCLMNLRSMCLSGQIKAFIYRNYCAKEFCSKLNILEDKF